MLKLFVVGNYFFGVDDVNHEIVCHKADALIQRSRTNSTDYTITFGGKGKLENIPFADLVDENDAAFVSQAAFQTWYTANTGFSTASGGSEVDPVDISAAQIKAIYDTPVELLAAGPAGTYPRFSYITLEFTDNGTPYTFADDVLGLYMYDGVATYVQIAEINPTFLATAGDKIYATVPIQSTEPLATPAQNAGLWYGKGWSLVLSAYSGNPLLGNGTIKAKLGYEEITFG